MLRFCLIILAILMPAFSPAQPIDVERKVWSSEFRQARGQNAAPLPPTRRVAAVAPMVGVTLWRARKSQPGDQAREILHEADGTEEISLERIHADTKLFPRDRLRISIESAQKGFLYVISREKYADGSAGPPLLIFPSTKILNGNNLVHPGRLIELPEADNRIPFFKLKPSRPDQVAEELILLVAPRPLPGLMSTEKPLRLEKSQVELWMRQWGAPIQSLELDGSKAWSRAEQLAGKGGTALTPADALPQTLYRVAGQTNNPTMVPLQLKLAQ